MLVREEFGVPALFMEIVIASFLARTPVKILKIGESLITKLCQVLIASFQKWNLSVSSDCRLLNETQDKTSVIEGNWNWVILMT